MRNSSGGCVALVAVIDLYAAIFAFIILAITGWVKNIIAFADCDFERLLGPLLPKPADESDEVTSDMARTVYGFVQRWLCEGVEDPTSYKQGAMRACLKLSR